MKRFTRVRQPRSTLAAGVLGVAVAAALALPAAAADMTRERAINVDREPHNWLLPHLNYQGHRFSKLTQITAANAKDLRPVFSVGLGGIESGGRYATGNLQATPIVEDGAMYTTDGWGSVYRIDVSSGRKGSIRWKMDPGTDRAWSGDVACCGVNNRGVSLWKDKVISIVLDGRVIATNKETGEAVWERKVADPAIAETITMAPLVIDDLVITGPAGGEFGIRGYLDATDLNTGKQAWRTFTIPGKGEPGNETWGGDSWMTGGASTWQTGTYDPELDMTYWGTGNAGPDYDTEYRPGDNLWAASLIAVAPKTGKLTWGFQYTPNDPYDYDEIAEHPLVDVIVNGQPRKLVVHTSRNGFFYSIDRTNGSFILGKQYTDKLTWTPGLDPKTGRPLNYDPTSKTQIYAPGSHGTRAAPKGETCPTIIGGKNWQPTAFDSTTNMIYVLSAEGCAGIETKQQADFVVRGGTVKPRERFTGGSASFPTEVVGSLKAIDVITGETKARASLPYPYMSGTLATAGGVVFAGGPDGSFEAYDSKTLQQLYSYNIGTGISAPPMSYAVNGKQYVAIMVGYNILPNRITRNTELTRYAPQSMLFVFSL